MQRKVPTWHSCPHRWIRFPVVDNKVDYRCESCRKPGIFSLGPAGYELTIKAVDALFAWCDSGDVVGEYVGWPVEVTYFNSEGRDAETNKSGREHR